MRVLVLAIALVAIAQLSWAVVADEPSDDSSAPPTIEQLTERIEKLEDRVRALEAERPGLVPAPRPPQSREFRPSPFDRAPSLRLPGDEGVPESWKRFEFNGLPYYIVPADETAPGSARQR